MTIDPQLEVEADHYEPTLMPTGEVPALDVDDVLYSSQERMLASAINEVGTLADINAAYGRSLDIVCHHSLNPDRPCSGCVATHAAASERVLRNDANLGVALAALRRVEVTR